MNELQNLLDQDKFSDSVWLERGLNPSDKKLCLVLENKLNEAIKNYWNYLPDPLNQKK